MPEYAANLTYLFQELPFLDRFEAAADAGFAGVEILFPYEDAVTEISRLMTRTGLPLVLMNMPPPNYTGGPRGFAAVPGDEDRFRHDFSRAMRYAERLKPRHVHIMAGKAEGRLARDTYLRKLSWAAAQAPGQSLTIEPVNQTDAPGYFLSDYDKATTILAEIDAPNLGLQFDAYHAQMITGDALATWDRVAPQVRHVQVAGAPGRHEPTDGELSLGALLDRLHASGYDGLIGAEYTPRTTTIEGLHWMQERAQA